MAGWPEIGSWNDAEPPTGTALAANTRLPSGSLTGFVVDVGPEPVPVAPVVLVVDVAEVDGVSTGVPAAFDFPPILPMPAARPAPARATAATPPAKTPWSVKVLRSTSPGVGTRAGAAS